MFPYFLNIHVSVSFRQCIDHAFFVSSSCYSYFLAAYQESIGITKRTLLLSPPLPPKPSPRLQFNMGWGGVAWRGVAWRGVEWSGVEWSGVEWSGVEWSGVEWSGVEWSGVE